MNDLPNNPFRFRDAGRAMARLLENPEDTRQAFVVVESLSGNSFQRLYRRVKSSESGRALLRERPSLVSVLSDRDGLRALPDGSLGRAYLAFVERAGITADGLVEASDTGSPWPDLPPDVLADFEFLADRMRDSHDLWHTVAGYDSDLVGEACVLAFTCAQTRNPGVGFISTVAYLAEGGRLGARPFIRQAFARGLRAELLPAAPWEELLPLPLDEVRKRLRVGAPPSYRRVTKADRDAMIAAGEAPMLRRLIERVVQN